jgi:PKD repeat protein
MKKILLLFCFALLLGQSYGQQWQGIGPANTTAINQIAEINGVLYAVGKNQAGDGIVSTYNGFTWDEVGSGFSASSKVSSIAFYDGNIYVAGDFSMDNGVDAAFNYVAKWDEANSRWVPVANGSVSGGSVSKLYVYGGKLFAGGDFDDLGSAGNNNLASWDGTSWSLVGTGISSATLANTSPHIVTSLIEYDGKLIVAGKFTDAGGILLQNIASWDGTNWAYLKGDATYEGGGVGGDEAYNYVPFVQNMVVFNNQLYIIGGITKLYNTNFLDANSTPVTKNMVVWDGADFAIPAREPSTNYVWKGIMVFNGTLYINYSTAIEFWNGDSNFNWETETSTKFINTLYANATTKFKGTTEVEKFSDPTASFYASTLEPCMGESVQFTDASSGSSAPTAWAWQFPGGTPTTSTEKNPTVSYSAEGNYDVILKVTSAEGVDSTTLVNYINVDETITIDTQPMDITTCPSTVNFSVAASSLGNLSYQWQLDSGLGSGFIDLVDAPKPYVGGALTNNLVYQPSFVDSGFKFRCKISRCSTEVISNEATLTVKDGPVVTAASSDQTICITGDAEFSVETTGGAGITYQWQIGGVDIVDGGVYSGANTATLTLTGVDETLTGLVDYQANITKRGTLKCIISADNGCSVELSRSLILYTALPPVNSITITSQPSDIKNTCRGSSSYRFSVSATNSATGYSPVYQWQVDDGNGFVDITSNMEGYFGYNNIKLVIPISLISTGTVYGYLYRCKVTASLCGDATYSNAAVLEVDNRPEITEHPSNATLNVCAEGTAEYSVVATGRALTYQWQATSSNGYFNDITDNANYSGTTTDKLVVNYQELVGANSKLSVRFKCVVSSGFCSRESSGSGLLNIFAQPDLTSTTSAGLLTICDGGATTLRVQPSFSFSTSTAPFGYQWQVDATGTGVFTDLEENEYYTRTRTNSLSIDSAVFAFNGNAYRCIIRGCGTENASEADTLTVLQLPIITEHPQSQTVCRNEQVTFTALATGSDVTYTWWKDTGSGTYQKARNASASPDYTFTANNTFNGYKYKCIAQAGDCTTSTAESFEATLAVHETNITTVSSTQLLDICAGETAQFGVVMSNLEGLTFQWSDDNGDLADGDVYAGVTNDTLTISAPTTAINNYTLSVTGDCGDDSFNSYLYVYGLETPVIEPNLINTTNPSLQVNTSFTLGVDNFEWFLNGNSYQNTGASPSLSLTEQGSYTVVATKKTCEHPESEAVVIVITGFENSLAAKGISMYPNPVSNNLTLEMGPDFDTSKESKIVLTDVNGKQVFTKRYNDLYNRKLDIDMSGFENGIYVVSVVNGDSMVQYKITKQ